MQTITITLTDEEARALAEYAESRGNKASVKVEKAHLRSDLTRISHSGIIALRGEAYIGWWKDRRAFWFDLATKLHRRSA